MKYTYFDIHSHLNLKPLIENKLDVLSRMREKGISTTVVGVDLETSKQAIELAHKHSEVLWATIGLHPADNTIEVFDYEKYLELARDAKVVAIGECGLDYYRLPESAEEQEKIISGQKDIFNQQIKIAEAVGKPLMIHARPSKGSMDAYTDVLGMLEEASFQGQVNFHFFVGGCEIAERIVSHDWTVSFDGPITFAREYDEVIRTVPLVNIMCETDAPFAAPLPYRGQTCEPYMVEEVYKKIAEIRGEDIEVVRMQILANVKRVFGIGE